MLPSDCVDELVLEANSIAGDPLPLELYPPFQVVFYDELDLAAALFLWDIAVLCMRESYAGQGGATLWVRARVRVLVGVIVRGRVG